MYRSWKLQKLIKLKNLRIPAKKVETWVILPFLFARSKYEDKHTKKKKISEECCCVELNCANADAGTSFQTQCCREILMGDRYPWTLSKEKPPKCLHGSFLLPKHTLPRAQPALNALSPKLEVRHLPPLSKTSHLC